MKKNKITILATAAVLTVAAGSAVLLGNNLTAPQLTAGQQTYARVATYDARRRTMTINAEAESYRNVSALFSSPTMMHGEFEIYGNQNVTSLVNVNKITLDATGDDKAVYEIISIDNVSIEENPILFTRTGNLFVANTNIASFSKLRFRVSSDVFGPYDFPDNVKTVTFNYNCVQ